MLPSNLRVVLNMLEQLYRHLATFHLFPSNLRAARNMLVQLYMDLANFLLFQNNPSCSKHAKAAVQGPGDLPLAHKQPKELF